jgi:branched-chain amino acid transport system substrate-binding protein
MKTWSTTIMVAGVAIALIIGLVGGYFINSFTTSQGTSTGGLTGAIPIGSMQDVSGAQAFTGRSQLAGIQLGVKDVNAFLNASGQKWYFNLIAVDSQDSPSVALTQLQSLAVQGVKAVLGITQSTQIRTMKAYSDANHILLMSGGSTDPSLSIAGSYIFRFAPDDTFQAQAIYRMLVSSNITHAVFVRDVGSAQDAIVSSIQQKFIATGGTVLVDVSYPVGTTSLAVEAGEIGTAVQNALNAGVPMKNICVVHCGHEEVVPLWDLLKNDYPRALNVTWFGYDGTALDIVISGQGGGAIASQVKYPACVFAVTSSPKYQEVQAQLTATLGAPPKSYAECEYDSVWVLALSMLACGQYDADAISKVMIPVANRYFGASGWTVLNTKQDRSSGVYDFWYVVKNMTDPTKYYWAVGATWDYTTDAISWVGLTPPS